MLVNTLVTHVHTHESTHNTAQHTYLRTLQTQNTLAHLRTFRAWIKYYNITKA